MKESIVNPEAVEALSNQIGKKVYSNSIRGSDTHNFTLDAASALIVIGRNGYGCAVFYIEQWGGKFKIYSSGTEGDLYENNITIDSNHNISITNPYSSYVTLLVIN